jgi:hypothetical protein
MLEMFLGKTSEADRVDILMSVTRDNLKRCIEGDIDGINEINCKTFSASVKLDCYIQCNKIVYRPVCQMCWTSKKLDNIKVVNISRLMCVHK